MRDERRIKRILEKIEKIWNDSPDQRFGQLLINLGIVDDSIRIWNNGDDGLERYLDEYLKNKVKSNKAMGLKKSRII